MKWAFHGLNGVEALVCRRSGWNSRGILLDWREDSKVKIVESYLLVAVLRVIIASDFLFNSSTALVIRGGSQKLGSCVR